MSSKATPSMPTPSAAGIPKAGGPVATVSGTVVGAAAGAAAGAIAGPPGMIVGGVLGAIAGAATAEALAENQEADAAAEQELDEEIGVFGGNMGAAQTTRPARVGAPSLASSGIGAPESTNQDGGASVVGAHERGD